MSALFKIENSLKKHHSAQARLFNLRQVHGAVEMRHNNFAQRRMQGWFDSVRNKHKSRSIIHSVEVKGTLISEPNQLAAHVQDFFEDWFGKNRKNWYVNEQGETHPLAADNQRGFQLREAFVSGTYDEVATDLEALPDCARRFMKVSVRKTITKGVEKGRKVTEKHFEHCELQYSADEFQNVRKGMNKTKRPGLSGLSKIALPLPRCILIGPFSNGHISANITS